MTDADKHIKSECRKERAFQDKKAREFARVKAVLNDTSLTADEKYVSLVALGYGKQRAQQIAYGRLRNDFN